MQPDDFPPGTVWLVGAGPGDPDLLTRKAIRLIESADIVFHDALVGPAVLDLIPAGAERVSVGKLLVADRRGDRLQSDIEADANDGTAVGRHAGSAAGDGTNAHCSDARASLRAATSVDRAASRPFPNFAEFSISSSETTSAPRPLIAATIFAC